MTRGNSHLTAAVGEGGGGFFYGEQRSGGPPPGGRVVWGDVRALCRLLVLGPGSRAGRARPLLP